MTPEQTKSAYRRACEQECPDYCGKGVRRYRDHELAPELPVFRHNASTEESFIPCTAPSPLALIERQTAQIAAMQAALAMGGYELERAQCERDEARAASQRLAVEIEELRRDRERLDWLTTETLVDFMIEDDDATFNAMGDDHHMKAVRDGIDAAMKEKP